MVTDQLSVISGADTRIQGAQLTGNHVSAVIGGNLSLVSEQDTDDYASKQTQVGAKGVIGMGGGGSVSASQQKVNSHYKSVTDVSGIQAGDGGFDIHVGGHTHLTGAVIGSSADASKNQLDTASLSFEDLHNEADYSASSIGGSLGYGGGGKGGGFSGSPQLGIPQDKDESNDTRAGIAHGTLTIRDNPTQDLSQLDRNASFDQQGLTPIFNAQNVQNNLEAGQLMGYVGMRAAGDVAGYMANRASTPEQKASWEEGGVNKALLHGMVGAAAAVLGGGNALQGATGALTSELASKAMLAYLDNHGITDPNQRNTLMQLGSAAIGGATGGAGAATALQGEQHNRQLHPTYVKHLQDNAAKYAAESCGCDLATLSPDARQEAIDNAANTLIFTAQRLQDSAFDNEHADQPLDSNAQAFLAKDNPEVWIGDHRYDAAHADDYERNNPSINGYALYQALNQDHNGGLDALMPATGKTMSDYYSLASSDFHSGRPEADAFEEGFRQWRMDESSDFLKFNGAIAASGAIGGAAANAQYLVPLAKEAWAAINARLENRTTMGAVIQGAFAGGADNLADTYDEAEKRSKNNGNGFVSNFQDAFSAPKFALDVTLSAGATGSLRQALKWADISPQKAGWRTPEGFVLNLNIWGLKKTASMAGNAAIEQSTKTGDQK